MAASRSPQRFSDKCLEIIQMTTSSSYHDHSAQAQGEKSFTERERPAGCYIPIIFSTLSNNNCNSHSPLFRFIFILYCQNYIFQTHSLHTTRYLLAVLLYFTAS